MKIEKITYQQTFPTGNFMNQKLGMEIILEHGDYPDVSLVNGEHEWNNSAAYKAFLSAKLICEETFKKLNPHVGEVHIMSDAHYGGGDVIDSFSKTQGNGIVTTTKSPEEKRLDSIEDQIMSCKEKKVLESYKFIAKTDKKLQEAYDKKMGEFV